MVVMHGTNADLRMTKWIDAMAENRSDDGMVSPSSASNSRSIVDKNTYKGKRDTSLLHIDTI
jgi:hypothetical protein